MTAQPRSSLGRGLAAALALLASLSGCTSGGESIAERLLPLIRASVSDRAPDVGRAVEPTREQLNQIPFAMIGFSYDELPPVYMIPLSDNDGYLTYQDEGRRGVVLFGGAVAGTEGLGNDLRAVRHAADDPFAHRMPLAEWPGSVERSYEYRVRDIDEYIITVACRIEPIGLETIEIVEIEFTLIRVDETCRNARRTFTNTYWVDNSGFAWASRQWLGPDLKMATIQVVRPYGG